MVEQHPGAVGLGHIVDLEITAHPDVMLSVAVHVLVVLLVLAGGDVVHPRLVVKIPADSFVDTLLELETRAPAQLAVQLRGVDGIPQVVARTSWPARSVT